MRGGGGRYRQYRGILWGCTSRWTRWVRRCGEVGGESEGGREGGAGGMGALRGCYSRWTPWWTVAWWTVSCRAERHSVKRQDAPRLTR